ncbi:MAG: caspase family protein [Rhizobiaceae bacterium]|nr:caspase family protein [Rhizobiaceae bacterium]
MIGILPHRLARAGRGLAAAVLALLALGASSRAQDAPEFYFDVDTGGHRAFVKDMAFTADGEYLVSGSDDKTIRIWDWRAGVTIRTLRGYIGEKHEGKVFGIAVSPDGKTIAAGGYFGRGLGDKPPYGDIRLFDFATGKMTGVLKAQEFAVYDVDFSPDGAYLAAGGQDGFVYVWRQDGTAASGWTAHTKLDADSWHIQKVAFAMGGQRLVAATTDNGVRLFDMGTEAEVEMPAADDLRDSSIMALAVSADGTRFATGNSDGQVHVWSAETGDLIRTLPQQPFLIGSLAFAAGDSRLIASCGYRCADQNRTVVWDTAGRDKPVLQYRGHDGTVFASAVTPDGALVATAGGTRHGIQVWDPLTGEMKHELQGIGHPVTSVGIDAAGSVIAWGTQNPCPEEVACPETMGTLETALLLPTSERFFEHPVAADEPSAVYRRAVHELGSWTLTAGAGGKDGLENAILQIAQNGIRVQSIENDATNGYLHASYTLIGNGGHLITGGNDGTLLEYNSTTGALAGEFLGGHTGEINAMAVSTGQRLLITGSADQTLRLWNLETRKLVVSMLFAEGEWVMWLPQGYYYSSDEGDKLIGWHVNQGRDAEGRFVRAGQLKRFLLSPELVRRAIILGDAEAAVQEMRPDVGNELARLLQRKPPEFEIRVADDQSTVKDGFVAVEIIGAQEAGTDVQDFSILSNSRNVGAFASRSISGDGKRAVIEVPVDDGENRIAITGVNEFGYVTERSVVALVKRETQAKKGKLYVVAIGVEKYPHLQTDCRGGPCDLAYSVDDAAEMLNVLRQRSAPLFTGMEALILVNQESLDEKAAQVDVVQKLLGEGGEMFEPDSDNIVDQVEDFLDRPGPDDTTIIFVAGHGINIDEDYYFIPTDGRKQDDGEKWRRSSLVDWGDVQDAVDRAKGVRLMLLDTCHAANAFNPRLEKDAADSRIIVFSATAANNVAQEKPELGHGVFTYSVLRGLKGAAGGTGEGVRLLHLAAYIYDEVVRLTGKQQEPFYYISNMGNILLAEP